jgi:hypothetical protein
MEKASELTAKVFGSKRRSRSGQAWFGDAPNIFWGILGEDNHWTHTTRQYLCDKLQSPDWPLRQQKFQQLATLLSTLTTLYGYRNRWRVSSPRSRTKTYSLGRVRHTEYRNRNSIARSSTRKNSHQLGRQQENHIRWETVNTSWLSH